MKSGPPAGVLRKVPGHAVSAVALAAAVVVASFVPNHAMAQGAPAKAGQGASFAIKGFKVTGENPLGTGETTAVLAPFLRTDATIETLQKATAALEAALRDKGHGLHRVALPPQEVGDTVTLEIVKFTIGKIAISGLTRYDEANIRGSLPELKEGTTPNFKRLAVQTTIANESPAKQITVSLKESDEPDKIDATVQVRESKPWNLAVTWANTGSSATGRDRLTVSGGHSNLFNKDHQFIGAYTTSVERPSDVQQIGLSYRIPLYEWGGVLGASFTTSDVLGNFGAFSSTGAGHTLGFNYTHHLPPEGGRRSYLTVGLDDKVFDVTQINGIPVPGQIMRRSRPVTIGYVAKIETDAAFWGYNADLAFNLPGGTGNNLAAYVTEDPRVTTARWVALRAGASYSGAFASKWMWSLRGQLQLSPDALISGEQFGLGGSSSVRGASERPISGDRGLFTSLEVSTPELMTGLRGIGFLDAGWLSNNNPNATNKPASDRLTGVGFGLRYSTPGGFAVSADYGRVLTGSVVPLAINASAPKKGDEKVHVNVSLRF